jgi:hypothetical protein
MGISTLDLTVTIEEGSGGGGGGGGSSSGGSGVDETPTTTQAAATTSTGATQTTSGVTTTSVSSGPTDTQPAQTTKSVVGPVQTTQSGAEQGQIAGVTTTPASTQAAPSGSDTGDGPNWWLIAESSGSRSWRGPAGLSFVTYGGTSRGDSRGGLPAPGRSAPPSTSRWLLYTSCRRLSRVLSSRNPMLGRRTCHHHAR